MKNGAPEEYDYLSPSRQQDQMNGILSLLPSPHGKTITDNFLGGEGGGIILAKKQQ